MTAASPRARHLATRGALLLPLVSACGSGSPAGPAPVATPSTAASPTTVHDVAVVVFYDQNDDGRLDRNEDVRIPDATVEIAGRTGISDRASGRAVVAGVADGPQDVVAPADGLPPFFVSGSRAIVVPTSADVTLPVALPIGHNRPHRYMAVGDSITVGDGSSGGAGYPGRLEAQLARHFGQALVVNRGVSATDTREGLKLVRGQLQAERPAYTLIHYGTNDWLHCAGQIPCYTVDQLRRIVVAVKGPRSLPCLATIIPANPKLNSPGRNNWIHNIDARIRELAAAEGALLVDLEAAFLRQPDLSALFSDHVHPNDRGYRIIADEFFRAITRARGTHASGVAAAAPPAG